MTENTGGTDLKPGQIAFYEAYRPPILGGDYLISAEQSVKGLSPTDGTPEVKLDQPFSIQSPRFVLGASAVRSAYPPANATGQFEQSLPHVVLNDRTLPWQRSIVPGVDDQTKSAPWLALLTFRPGELAKDDLPTRRTVAELVDPPAGVVGPKKLDVSGAELKAGLMTLDIPGDRFTAIAPSYQDQFYLAHVREVNTDGKEILGVNADGWFSLVIGNRLIGPGGKNLVCLVSLEGMADYLPGGTTPPGANKVRIAVLASWTFEAMAARGNFIEIMQALGTRHVRGDPSRLNGIELLAMPLSLDAPRSDAEKLVAETIAIGFAPVATELRDGEKTTSWYRGPFAPVPTKRIDHGPYVYGEHAVRYDPETGIFDLSYAAAWQIGRLLALSDATFATRLARNVAADNGEVEQRVALQDFDKMAENVLAMAARVAAGAETSRRGNAGVEAAKAVIGQVLARGVRENPERFPTIRHKEDRFANTEHPGLLSATDLAEVAAGSQDAIELIKRRVFGDE